MLQPGRSYQRLRCSAHADAEVGGQQSGQQERVPGRPDQDADEEGHLSGLEGQVQVVPRLTGRTARVPY